MTDSGYKTSEMGFSLGTRFEQFQNIFLSPEIDFLIEDLETSSKASSTLKNKRVHILIYILIIQLIRI